MKRMPLKFIISVIVFTESVFGWGKTGHRIIGMVAENYLSEVAKTEIKKLQEIYSNPKSLPSEVKKKVAKEIKQKKSQMLKAKKKGDIYSDNVSSYRIFSRLFCNFVFCFHDDRL